MIIMIIIFYFINKSDEKGVGKDLAKESTDEIEKFTGINRNCNECLGSVYENKSPNYSVNKIYENAKEPITKVPVDKNVLIESGYIDFDGNYKIGKDYSEVNFKNLKI